MKQLTFVLGILLLSSSVTLAQANCNDSPPDGLSPQAAYSIFYTNYQNGDYDFALKYGRWMTCAKLEKIEGISSYKLEKQYNRLINIYEEVGRSKQDPSERSAYIDTALSLFSERLELFGDNMESRHDIIFKRGRFYQQNYDNIENGLEKAYSDYEEMFNINPEKSTNLGDGYYLRIVLDNIIKEGRTEEAQELIDTVKPIVEGELLEFVEEKQQDLLGTPEEQIEYFEPVVEEDPEDINAWKALKNAYEEISDRAELKRVLVKIYELEPTFNNALEIAELEKSNANYNQAVEYFQNALDKASTDEQRKALHLNLADVNINLEKLETAKKHVQEALDIDPDDGNSYMKMATIYGAAVNQCTEDRKLEAQDKVVYWLVIDYLNKAKSVDSSVVRSVNSQLATYEDVTPSAEDKFFTLGYENGQKVTINSTLMPCYSWINETVTVR